MSKDFKSTEGPGNNGKNNLHEACLGRAKRKWANRVRPDNGGPSVARNSLLFVHFVQQKFAANSFR